MEETKSFITSVVVGKDVIPRQEVLFTSLCHVIVVVVVVVVVVSVNELHYSLVLAYL